MCDRRTFFSSVPPKEVEHVELLSEDFGKLCLDDEFSDVTLVVEDESFPSHKVILAARSEYFRAMLFGGMKESQPGMAKVVLHDTSAAAFRILVQYIYTGRVVLSSLKEDLILDILGLVHQYGFQALESSICHYLKAILNINNVCMIYDAASLYNLVSLRDTCFEYMDRHALEVLNSGSFLALSASSVYEMICRDSFCAPESEIFYSVKNWTGANPVVSAEEILKAVRLPLMTLQDLLNVVRPTNLFPADAILDAIKERVECRNNDLNYRGILIIGENLVSPRHGAVVIKGEVKSALLDGDVVNYDMDRGYTRHPIEEPPNTGIVVKLGMQCIINCIRLLLWDKDMRSYSYFVEVSMDDSNWTRVVDHSRYLCRSWQRLYFPARVVKYIRVVGTHNTINRVFHLVAMEAYYTKDVFCIERGLIVPKENVASTQHDAVVIDGVSRSRNALINGDIHNYDWDSGYTCHQLGSGSIIVQLAQPYLVSSMRLLLWDCDDRCYSFLVEVSTDNQRWEIVCDRTKERCRSWQTITFAKRAITFIKIVGTHNTANEVFHVVHFECPATGEVTDDSEPLVPGDGGNSTDHDRGDGGNGEQSGRDTNTSRFVLGGTEPRGNNSADDANGSGLENAKNSDIAGQDAAYGIDQQLHCIRNTQHECANSIVNVESPLRASRSDQFQIDRSHHASLDGEHYFDQGPRAARSASAGRIRRFSVPNKPFGVNYK